jgi:release factor glutamine methyltransferase
MEGINDEPVYEPQEDSYFLLDCLKKELEGKKIGRALEIGTGSGILAIEAAKSAKKVLAVDINPDAISEAKLAAKKAGTKNIEFVEGDLFGNVSGRFDLIFFNPPYLPGRGEACLCGGKRGQEVIERFLGAVGSHLKDGGKALILLSSFNDVESLKKKYGFRIVADKKLWFEALFCAEIKKS